MIYQHTSDYKNFRWLVEALRPIPYRLAVCGHPLAPEEVRLLESGMLLVARRHADAGRRTNLAEYLEKGIVK